MVQCPSCQAENRDEAKFCAQCGQPLTGGETGPVTEPATRMETPSQEAIPAEASPPAASALGNAVKQPKTSAAEEVAPPEIALTEAVLSKTAPTAEPPTPLPEGALLCQRRYELLEFLGERDGVNEYRAVETDPRKRCPVCQTLNAADSRFCEQCGSDLSEADAVQLVVRVREAGTDDALRRERVVHERGLHHAAIAAPLAVFTDMPYEERSYAVLPEMKGTPLSQVEAEDVATALAWAHLLADALAQLDDKGLGLACPLHEAVRFTDSGEPFIPTEAISLEPCDWQPVRQELKEAVRCWLDKVQGSNWIPRAVSVIERATNWRETAQELEKLLVELQTPPALRLTVTQMTDVGRRREHNEDSYLTMKFERCHLDRTETLAVLAVADGMGGHAAGEVASKLCLQVFGAQVLTAVQQWLNFNQPDWHKVLRHATEEANRQVFTEAQAMHNNMGTTLTAGVVMGNRVIFANVGDSRGYLLQNGKLRQITKDHSYVQQLVDLGMITPEQARHHPQGHVITRAVGIEPEAEVDTFEEPLRIGDLILLCSDGLVDMVEDAEIERVLLSEPDLQKATETLVRLANEAGGDDNITVVLAKVM